MSAQPNTNRNTRVKLSTSVAQVANRNLISNRICMRPPAFPRDPLPVHHLAAIHVDGLTRDLTAPRRGEEHHHVRYILRLLPSGEGRYCPHFVVCPVIVGSLLGWWLLIVPRLPDAFVQRRAHHTRTDNVDPNSMGRKVFRQALREVDICRFAGAVRWVRLGTDLSSDGGEKNESSLLTRDHSGRNRMRRVHHSHHVDLQHPEPIAGREIGKWIAKF